MGDLAPLDALDFGVLDVDGEVVPLASDGPCKVDVGPVEDTSENDVGAVPKLRR